MIDATIITAFNKSPFPEIKKYEECAIRFVRSIRINGGACCNIPIIIWYDRLNKPDDKYFDILSSFGCEFVSGTVEIPQPSKSGSWSSKLYALNDCMPNTKYSAWFDVDIYVLSDFSWLFKQPEDVLIAPMQLITNFAASSEYDDMWNMYYNYFELQRPEIKILTVVDKKPSHLYGTSGLFVFKNDLNFGKEYKEVASKLYYSGLPYCDKRYNQTAIPITIIKNKLTWNIIPKKYHHLYHLNNYKLDNDTVICHYCDNIINEISKDMWNV